MTCYAPLYGTRDASGAVVFTAKKGTDFDVTVPCGQCVGCRISRRSMWQLRCMHESSLHDRNCFVTLTYADEHLPAHGSLQYADVQKFFKRLRKAGHRFRYFVVGEYGDNTERAHYHVLLFGYWPPDAVRVNSLSPSPHPVWSSSSLTCTWGLGQTHVMQLTKETAGYCAGYCFKKLCKGHPDYAQRYGVVNLQTGELNFRAPEFARMSTSPGIGAHWYQRYGSTDVHQHDYCILDGRKLPVPKYYDRILEKRDPDRLAELKESRESNSLKFKADNTPKRRVTKAEVATAKLSQQPRGKL